MILVTNVISCTSYEFPTCETIVVSVRKIVIFLRQSSLHLRTGLTVVETHNFAGRNHLCRLWKQMLLFVTIIVFPLVETVVISVRKTAIIFTGGNAVYNIY